MSEDNQDSGQIVTLENVRLSYFYGFEPYEGTNNEGKATRTYCTHALMTPTHPGIQLVKNAQRLAAQAEYGQQWEVELNRLSQLNKLALHKGDLEKPGEENYAGMVYVSANNGKRPSIVVTQGGVNVPIGPEHPCAPYSGCWASVMVRIWAQGVKGKSAKWGKRINARLMGVQFLRHDASFGGGRVARPEEFGIAPVDADGAVPTTVGVAPANSVSDLV